MALSPHGARFEEARTILAHELEVPATYFSLLSVLAIGPADHSAIHGRGRGPLARQAHGRECPQGPC